MQSCDKLNLTDSKRNICKKCNDESRLHKISKTGMEPRTCKWCEKGFMPKVGGYNAKYCGEQCSKASYAVGRRPRKSRAGDNSHYLNNVKNNPVQYEKHIKRSKVKADKNRDWLAEYKTSRGCVDCGFNLHYSALQLDHTKKKQISFSACRSSVKRMLKEIEEGGCVVRCANCHSIKTCADKNKTEYNLYINLKMQWRIHDIY